MGGKGELGLVKKAQWVEHGLLGVLVGVVLRTKPAGYIRIYKKRFVMRDWFTVVQETERPHNLWSVSWRPREAGGAILVQT